MNEKHEEEIPLNWARRGGRPAKSKQTVAPAPPRIPRIARLMALAVKFQNMIDRGAVRDYADLARLGCVSRARITQIMNLLNLASDIQEQLLDLPSQHGHRGTLSETHIRRVSKIIDWAEQHQVWRKLSALQAGSAPRGHRELSPA